MVGTRIAASHETRFATVPAQPQPFVLDISACAVLVIDMQNDFGTEGGMFHCAGIDISMIQRAVEPTRRVLDAVRQVGIPVVYLKMGFRPDLSDAGPVQSPNYARHQLLGVGSVVRAPDGSEGRVLVRDTWNTDIVAELAPGPADIVLYKHRFSGFFETDLDAVLRGLGVRHLVVTGCTTSICVESTIRDAMFRDYCCMLLEDCTAEPIGDGLPRSNHEASLLSIRMLLGWTSSSREFIGALGLPAPRIEHVAFWARDLDALCDFYARHFGATVGPLYENPAHGFRSRFLRFADGARLEVMSTTQLAPAEHAPGAQRMGLTHLALSLGSEAAVDALTQRLAAAGVPVLDGPRRTGDGYYESVVLDPEGNRLELTA